MAGAAFARSVVVSRAAVFFHLARSKGALQADGDWSGVGGVATAAEHGRVHFIFWAAGEIAFGRAAVPGVLFCGFGSMDLFFDGIDHDDERRGGEPAGGHESVFSAIDSASFERALRPGGFCNCVRGAVGDDAGVRIAAGSACDLVAVFAAAGAGDCTRSWVVAFGVERVVPRRAVCNAVPGAVLDAGVAGGVSEQPGAWQMAMAVRIESDGRGK